MAKTKLPRVGTTVGVRFGAHLLDGVVVDTYDTGIPTVIVRVTIPAGEAEPTYQTMTLRLDRVEVA